MAGHIIHGDLSEKQTELDIAKFLGWCSAGLPFDLRDVNEQSTGADLLLYDVTIPIYLQVKKSTGLMPVVRAKARRKNAGPLQDIREFRNTHALPDNPTLYFQLRKQAKYAKELQHNVLYANHQPPHTYAIYVAPLYLDRATYYKDLCSGPRCIDTPWEWRLSRTFMPGYQSGLLSRFDMSPFLRNHISIAPHERVADHEHYYAYSTAGDDVSWHSPEIVDGGHSRLSDFMTDRTRDVVIGDFLPHPEQTLNVTKETLKRLEEDNETDILSGDSPIDKLRSYGRWLYQTYQIRQVLLCARRDELADYRLLPDLE